jgi:hypothetical protein
MAIFSKPHARLLPRYTRTNLSPGSALRSNNEELQANPDQKTKAWLAAK